MTPTASRPQKQSITILSWRACERNTLIGFVDVSLPSGIIIRGISLHQKGESRRWIGLPARPYETDSGSMSWQPIVEIPDKARRQQFEQMVLDAFDVFLEAQHATHG